jgi:ATP-binding cassette subfamily B protein
MQNVKYYKFLSGQYMNNKLFLKDLIKKNGYCLFFIVFGGLLIIASTSYIPYYLGLCFQYVSNMDGRYLAPLGILVIFYVIRAVFKLVRNHFAALLGNKVVMGIRVFIMKNILELNTHKNTDNHEAYSILTYDLNILSEIISWRTFVFIEDICILGVSIYIVSKLSFIIAAMMLLAFVLIFIVSFFYGKKLEMVIGKIRNSIALISSIVFDNITTQKAIRAFNAGRYEYNKFSKENERNYNLKQNQNSISKIYLPFMEGLAFMAFISMMGTGCYLVLFRNLDIGSVVTINGYMWLLVSNTYSLSSIVLFFINSFISVKRIRKYFSENASMGAENESNLEAAIETIEIQNISCDMGGKKLFENLSVNFKKGTIVTIKGETGGGKSTLMDILACVNPAYTGAVMINGQNIRNLNKKSIFRRIGYVTQYPVFFNATLEENIVLYRIPKNKERLEFILKGCCLEEVIKNMKDGLKTAINRDRNFLSGGEKQRICLARALLCKPDVLIIDDAITAIDSDNQMKILDMLQTSKQDRILVFVSNLESVIGISDFVYELSDGRCGRVK